MMSREIKERQLSMAWLNHQRMLLGIGATIYFAWWFVVDQLLPSSFNPFMSRLVVSFGMLATLGLSFVTVFVRRHFDIFYSICAYALILHYFYLFYHNPSDINWLVGSYVAVVTVGSTFETRSKLIGFSIIVIAVTAYVAFHESSILVAVPGMFTILALLHIVRLYRSKADEERKSRMEADTERASVEVISRAKSLFLANMSHELRTPLTSVVGFSDLLADAEELSPECRVYVDRIRRNARSLMDMVNEILNITEEDFAQLQLNIKPFSIRKLVTGILREMSAADGKRLSLSLTILEPFSDELISNPSSVERVLRHILGNAFKFTQVGEVEVTLSTKPSESLDEVMLIVLVRDTGVGIADADKERIFEVFRQAQEDYTRPFGGVGLGLSIARKIARAMGGDITIVESTPGKGTTMRITILAHLPPVLEESVPQRRPVAHPIEHQIVFR